jgi:DNA-damage-inducible protein J
MAVPNAPSGSDTYDNWLKAEIQEALDDTSPTIPHDDVIQDIRAMINQARVKHVPA